MISLTSRVILAAVYLIFRASYGKCYYCPQDVTDSGCWMCPGSDLRSCWDESLKQLAKCENKKFKTLQASLDCFCPAFTKVTKCWSQGRCCTEYAPTLAAAANVCNLRTYPEDEITKEKHDDVISKAYHVKDAIWHNDSGVDVPKMDIVVQPHAASKYSGHPSYNTEENASYTPKPKPKSELTSSYLGEKKTSTSTHSFSTASSYSTHVENVQSLSTSGPTDVQNKQEGGKKDVSPSYHHQVESKNSRGPQKVHHTATCSAKEHKCQKHIASQYQHARQDRAKTRHIKRVAISQSNATLSSDHRLQKRSPTPSHHIKCGVDFQGVTYPEVIPETVLAVFPFV